MSRATQLSLVFAAISPALLFLLANGIGQWMPVPIIVGLILLCPLAAAFSGHRGIRQFKENTQKQGGLVRTAAVAGTALGYLEIFTLVLLVATTPIHHRNPMGANESSAVGSLRSLAIAAKHYEQTHPVEGFPTSLKALVTEPSSPESPWTVDPILASGQKSGYRFLMSTGNRESDGHIRHYQIHADPAEQDKTGVRHFYVDETGVVRYNLHEQADSKGEALQ